jgi:hypothetical protein
MISRLIEFEHAETRTGCYFFDFDKTITYVAGTCFNFIMAPSKKDTQRQTQQREESEKNLLQEYTRYLVSNYVNEEPAVEPAVEPARRGRMQLLQQLFDMIGPARLYIVTANPNACPTNTNLQYFIMTIRVLLPSFDETHLISANPNCKPRIMYRNKGVAISTILSTQTGGGGAAKPKNKRKPTLSRRRSQSRGVVSRKKQYRQRRFSRTMRHRRK